MTSLNNGKELNGKLGVFWFTQGFGKSYSMVIFARKVIRKVCSDPHLLDQVFNAEGEARYENRC